MLRLPHRRAPSGFAAAAVGRGRSASEDTGKPGHHHLPVKREFSADGPDPNQRRKEHPNKRLSCQFRVLRLHVAGPLLLLKPPRDAPPQKPGNLAAQRPNGVVVAGFTQCNVDESPVLLQKASK